MKIALIRHGKTKGNIEKKYIGKTDESLTKIGIKEIKLLKNKNIYPDFKTIYSSPLKRALETAKIIYPDNKCFILEEIREMDFGIFENKTYEEIISIKEYKEFGSSEKQIYFPNGEDIISFKNRCVKTFQDIVSKAENCSIICHGGCIMAVMEEYGIPKSDFYTWNVQNGKGYIIDIDINYNIKSIKKI